MLQVSSCLSVTQDRLPASSASPVTSVTGDVTETDGSSVQPQHSHVWSRWSGYMRLGLTRATPIVLRPPSKVQNVAPLVLRTLMMNTESGTKTTVFSDEFDADQSVHSARETDQRDEVVHSPQQSRRPLCQVHNDSPVAVEIHQAFQEDDRAIRTIIPAGQVSNAYMLSA